MIFQKLHLETLTSSNRRAFHTNHLFRFKKRHQLSFLLGGCIKEPRRIVIFKPLKTWIRVWRKHCVFSPTKWMVDLFFFSSSAFGQHNKGFLKLNYLFCLNLLLRWPIFKKRGRWTKSWKCMFGLTENRDLARIIHFRGVFMISRWWFSMLSNPFEKILVK